jgi:hypothetical protein
VATYVYASSQGQRTHSARIKRLGVDFVFTLSQSQSQPHQKVVLAGNLGGSNLILTQLDQI